MAAQGRLGDQVHVMGDAHGCPSCPHVAMGPASSGSKDVFVNGREALRVGDDGRHGPCCGAATWTAVAGSATVFINGKPAFREGDASSHCGAATGKLIE